MDMSTIKNSLTLKKWVIGISVMLCGLFIIRTWLDFDVLSTVKETFHHVTANQEQAFKNSHDQSNKIMNDITQGMINGVNELNKRGEEFSKSLNDFNKDFSGSYEKAVAEAEKMHQHIIYEFEHGNKAFDDAIKKQEIESDKWYAERERLNELTERREERKKIAACIAKSKRYIACEKRLFGQSIYNPKKPCDYNALYGALWTMKCDKPHENES